MVVVTAVAGALGSSTAAASTTMANPSRRLMRLMCPPRTRGVVVPAPEGSAVAARPPRRRGMSEVRNRDECSSLGGERGPPAGASLDHRLPERLGEPLRIVVELARHAGALVGRGIADGEPAEQAIPR